MFSEEDKKRLEEIARRLDETPPYYIPSMEVEKYAYFIQASTEELIDAGLIEDTREPYEPPKLSRWLMFKWNVSAYIYDRRLVLGAWIAGIKPSDWDKY